MLLGRIPGGGPLAQEPHGPVALVCGPRHAGCGPCARQTRGPVRKAARLLARARRRGFTRRRHGSGQRHWRRRQCGTAWHSLATRAQRLRVQWPGGYYGSPSSSDRRGRNSGARLRRGERRRPERKEEATANRHRERWAEVACGRCLPAGMTAVAHGFGPRAVTRHSR
jgi:hypothetical protein